MEKKYRVLNLLACEHFRKGEKGYATGTGVWKLYASEVPDDGFRVQAKADIGPGQHGPFLDLQSQSGSPVRVLVCPRCKSWQVTLLPKIDKAGVAYFRCAECAHAWSANRKTGEPIQHLTPLPDPES